MTANPRGGNYLAARASQIVPYMCPSSVCDRDDHAECWREYSRQEDERKYRPE